MTDMPTIIGSIGVALLLAAFFLNLVRRLPQDGTAYIVMNMAGAGLACWASWLIGFQPFVVLAAAGELLVDPIALVVERGLESLRADEEVGYNPRLERR